MHILNWRDNLIHERAWPFLVGNWLVCTDGASIGWCQYTPDCPLSMQFLSRNNDRLSSVREFLLPIIPIAEQLQYEKPWSTEVEFAGDTVFYKQLGYAVELLERSPVAYGDHQAAQIEVDILSPTGKSRNKGFCLVTKWGHNGYGLIAPR